MEEPIGSMMDWVVRRGWNVCLQRLLAIWTRSERTSWSITGDLEDLDKEEYWANLQGNIHSQWCVCGNCSRPKWRCQWSGEECELHWESTRSRALQGILHLAATCCGVIRAYGHADHVSVCHRCVWRRQIRSGHGDAACDVQHHEQVRSSGSVVRRLPCGDIASRSPPPAACAGMRRADLRHHPAGQHLSMHHDVRSAVESDWAATRLRTAHIVLQLHSSRILWLMSSSGWTRCSHWRVRCSAVDM